MKDCKLNLYIYGANSLVGKYLKSSLEDNSNVNSIQIFGREKVNGTKILDLEDPLTAKSHKFKKNAILINLAPIWSFSKYLVFLDKLSLQSKINIKKVITCSSSSVLTKKYSNNKKEKDLVHKICESEQTIISFSKKNQFTYNILRPTLIYGRYGEITDKNISKIKFFLKILPFLILPKQTGFRQPIHASQLVNIINYLLDNENHKNKILNVGGDENISYQIMIERIIELNFEKNKFIKCPIFQIPNRIFYFTLSILIILNPNLYSAIYRIGSDLSGFRKAHSITNSKALPFPVKDKN